MGLIPFDQRDGIIWFNGEMVPWKDAKIHVLSHGLHYGGCVFEGLRMYNGKIFKLTEHSERLIHSAKVIDMHIPYSVADIDAACEAVVKANNLTNAYLRPVAWRGSTSLGVSGKNIAVNVAIAAWDWGKYFQPKRGVEKGLSLQTSRWKKPAPDTAPTDSKAACLYVLGTMARDESDRAGFDDALMLDYRGYVAESSGANLFMIKDGKIYTPIADCFLNGITRQTVIELARNAGFNVEECRIQPDELLTADEIFVTGTAAEVTPVGLIDETEFAIGPVTQKLKGLYEGLTGQV